MKKRHLIIFLTIIFTCVTLVHAQGDDHLLVRTVDDDETPQVNDQNYPELLLELSPLNEVGIPIASLSDINFTLVDDGVALAGVTAVPFIDIEQQVSVLVVLDVSGPMQPWLPMVKTAVEPFYLALEQWDESAVITFTSLPDGTSVDVNALQPLDPMREWGFTNDEGALRNLINAQRAVPNAGTPLYDGMYKGIRVAATQAAHPRRAVLLITNGADQSSGEGTTGSRIAGADIVIEESRKTGVPIFTIGLGNEVDAAFLQRAAILTGGSFTQAAGPSELADAMAGVVHQLKQAYRLTATAVTPSDNQLHPLSITVSSSAGIAMKTVNFNAWYPETPQVEDVQLRLANGKQFSLETVRNANGTLTIVPQIMARHDIVAVNYYLNGDETAVFQATAPPWTFTWDTTTLPSSGPVTLVVEAVDSANPAHISRYETDLTITACDFFCQMGISSQLGSVLLLVLLALVLLVLLVMLVQRMRAGTAVPPIETVPQVSVLQQQPVPQQQPSFQRSGPAIQAMPNIHDPFPHSTGDMAALPVLVNEATNESFPLRYDMRIGRDPGTNIRLAGDTVADHHAIIKRERSQYVLVINGRHKMSTTINGAPVDQRHPLTDGDVIQIGEHQLRFMLSG